MVDIFQEYDIMKAMVYISMNLHPANTLLDNQTVVCVERMIFLVLFLFLFRENLH